MNSLPLQNRKPLVGIFSDSMSKHIVTKELNNKLSNNFAKISTNPGATTINLAEVIESKISIDKYDTVILHCGTNDISPRNGQPVLNDFQIAQNIVSMGLKCQNSGVRRVIVSGIIPRNDEYNARRGSTNHIIRQKCLENGLLFLNNDNIPTAGGICRDNLHLSRNGVKYFEQNLVYIINSS